MLARYRLAGVADGQGGQIGKEGRLARGQVGKGGRLLG